MQYNHQKKQIILNRELNKLDNFFLNFTKLLDNYVIVSGYVSILFGRSRATEDIDVFIKKFSYDDFKKLYKELDKTGFWCINAENPKEVFSYLKEGNSIRF